MDGWPARGAGPVVLVWRLATRDLRRRLTQSVLLLSVIAAATSTLAMAGPVLRTGEIADPVFAEGRDQTMPSVDRPYVTAGSWVRSGGVVIERAFAEQLNVHVGSRVTLDNRPFQVVGIAVDTDRGANWRPQLVWVTRTDALGLASPHDELAYVLNLRLADPAAAPAFAAAHSTPSLFIATWQQIRSSDDKELTVVQIVLLVGTWLLAMLAIASVAVLVGGRMVEQTRRAGLIKAPGAARSSWRWCSSPRTSSSPWQRTSSASPSGTWRPPRWPPGASRSWELPTPHRSTCPKR